jgi:hypothetical protein
MEEVKYRQRDVSHDIVPQPNLFIGVKKNDALHCWLNGYVKLWLMPCKTCFKACFHTDGGKPTDKVESALQFLCSPT